MEFIKGSRNIRVFPASLRTYDGMGKYTTENNLTGIPRSVTDFDSFLITRKKGISPFRFVIHGYYFEMDDMGFASSGADVADANMYIHIKVENGQEYSRLVDYEDGGTDIDNAEGDDFMFRALMIDGEALEPITEVMDPDDSEKVSHYIYTLRLTDDKGNLAEESFIRDLPDSIGDREGKSIGIFETKADGTMGFSKPIYLKAIGGFTTTNAIFWGDLAPSPRSRFINKDNVDVHLDAKIGDIFFKLQG